MSNMLPKMHGHGYVLWSGKSYSLESLCKLLEEKGHFAAKPHIQKFTSGTRIVLPGGDPFINTVTVFLGHRIKIMQRKPDASGKAKTLALEAVTDNWAGVFNVEGQGNKAILKATAKEVQRVVKENK